MAVEAQHINLFPSQLPSINRDFIKLEHGSTDMLNGTQIDSGLGFNNIMPATDTNLLPRPLFYDQKLNVCNPISAKVSMNNSDSGLTCNGIPGPIRSKRPRDHSPINEFDALIAPQKSKFSNLSSFIDQDTLFQIQLQQQSEIDRFIAEHTRKVRMELEERKRRQSAILASTIRERVMKKLKDKDEEIQRIGKLNWVLQERVKSLYVENQIWRDLAQTNEATANSLRTNLEQVLAAHVSDDNNNRHVSGGGGVHAEDDAESSCGSSNHVGKCTVGAGGGEEEVEIEKVLPTVGGVRLCRKCGVKESSVLLLPCRHLCLCTMCGSTLFGTCPVCDSVMNGTVHVNMS